MATRRSVLKQIGIASGAMALSPLAFCQVKSAKEKLGVALVGLGYYSTDLLAPALQQTEHCYLAGIVTGSPEKVPLWRQKYDIPESNVYSYQDFDSIAENKDIDIVYVVLPNSMHAEFTIRAAKAGKHVWCEKPMAMNVEECEAMIKACVESQVSLAIGYRMQHEPNTQKVMGFSNGNEFGPVRMVSVAAGFNGGFEQQPRHWKVRKAMGGGAMYDMGVYAIQGARYTIGEEPVAVTAHHQTRRPAIFDEVDETTIFQLEFPGGALAQGATSFGISMNYLHATYAHGWLRLDPFQSYRNVGGEASGNVDLTPWEGYQQAKQMDDDALAIKQGKSMMVPGEEGLRDIRVLEAIYKAASTGRRVEIV